MKKTMTLCLLSLALFALSACTTGSNGSTTASVDVAAPEQPLYYSFSDISVPPEMKLKDTFVIGTMSEQTGYHMFKGNVEFRSLANAMIQNMRRDGWTLTFQFQSPRTLLLFAKADRFSVLNITDGSMNTELEIWVAPRTQSANLEAPAVPSYTSTAPMQSTVRDGVILQ